MIRDIRRWPGLIGALVLVLSSISTAQSNYDAEVAHARENIRAGNYRSALTNAQTAITQNPDRWEAYAVAGTALSMQGDRDQAMLMLSKAVARAPQDKRATIERMIDQLPPARPAEPAPSAAPDAFGQLRAELGRVRPIDYAAIVPTGYPPQPMRVPTRYELLNVMVDAGCEFRFENRFSDEHNIRTVSYSLSMRDVRSIQVALDHSVPPLNELTIATAPEAVHSSLLIDYVSSPQPDSRKKAAAGKPSPRPFTGDSAVIDFPDTASAGRAAIAFQKIARACGAQM